MIHKYETEGISPKDFRNSQILIKLSKDLRDGNTDPKEPLKDQINSKSGLDEINKGNKQSKSEDQISVIQNAKKVFDLREKIIDFFRDYSFFLSKAKYRAKYGKNIWESFSDLKNFRSTPSPFTVMEWACIFATSVHFCNFLSIEGGGRRYFSQNIFSRAVWKIPSILTMFACIVVGEGGNSIVNLWEINNMD